jgi:hypothetical protein
MATPGVIDPTTLATELVQVGGASNDTITGIEGIDRLVGMAGNDTLIGLGGNDVLVGGASDLGAWQFVLRADGVQAQRVANGQTETFAATALDKSAPDMSFLAADSKALANLALLYQSAFGRAPDLSGLSWQATQKLSAVQYARNFLDSAEWASLHPQALSNSAFVQLMYQNVLNRAPDSAGQAFWQQALDGGTSRAELLSAFALSDEHRAQPAFASGISLGQKTVSVESGMILGSGNDRLDGGAGNDLLIGGDGVDTIVYAGTLANYQLLLDASGQVKLHDKANSDTDTLSGIELGSFADGTVDLSFTQAGAATLKTIGLMYHAVLGHTGDLAGFSFWANAHLDVASLAAGFAGSTEFQAKYGAMDNNAFVLDLYRTAGLRTTTAGGSFTWTAYLETHSRAEMIASWVGLDVMTNNPVFLNPELWLV